MIRHTYMFRFRKGNPFAAAAMATRWHLEGLYNQHALYLIAEEIAIADEESPAEDVSLWISLYHKETAGDEE